jgi:UDP-N-acetylmuramoylalanine--D-glutamate ligase
MTIAELQRKRTAVIIGYGLEGKATEAFLQRVAPHLKIVIADVSIQPDYLDLQTTGDLVIKTPSLPGHLLYVPYTTATNLFFANVPCPVIGVTGSKGKSTTSALIAAMIRAHGITAHLLGNIGVPALSLLPNDIRASDVVVFEMSSYQTADLDRTPHIAVYTSFFPEHIDHHGSLEAYAEAKARITLTQTPDDVFIFHADDPELARVATKTQARTIPIPETLPFPLPETRLLGEHNHRNIRAAWVAASLVGVTPQEAAQAIHDFEPLPHRLTNIGTYLGITFVDDAIATAPEATIEALKCHPDTTTLFLGGKDRGYQFDDLADFLATTRVKTIILFPKTGVLIRQALERRSPGGYTFFETSSMKDAVAFAYTHTVPGTTCLLSCASPSYSLWKNFEEKGREFTLYVKHFGEHPQRLRTFRIEGR